MRMKEPYEGVVGEFTDFGEWSEAVKSRGGVKQIKTPSKQVIYAVDREDKPTKHAIGMWDEKFKKGVVYAIRKKLVKGVDYDLHDGEK